MEGVFCVPFCGIIFLRSFQVLVRYLRTVTLDYRINRPKCKAVYQVILGKESCSGRHRECMALGGAATAQYYV